MKHLGHILPLLLLTACLSCHRQHDVPMTDYVLQGETLRIPREVADFDTFIDDSITAFNAAKLMYALLDSKPEQTFEHHFSTFLDDVELYTYSDDDHNDIRLYSLTLPDLRDITFVQYRGADGVRVEEFLPWGDGPDVSIPFTLFDADTYCTPTDIHSVDYLFDVDGRHIALVSSMSRNTPYDIYYNVSALTVEDGELTRLPLFRIGDDRTEFGINVTVLYSPDLQDDELDHAFSYNIDTRNLHIPHITDSDGFTGRYLIYHFDGKDFVYQGTRGHDWMPAALRSFAYHVATYTTDTYRVRLDEMPDGTYRYASWSAAADYWTENPALILHGGIRDRNVVRFTNDSYTYEVPAYPSHADTRLKVYHHNDLIVNEPIH